MSDGALNDALHAADRLAVERLDEVIRKLGAELEQCPEITDEQRLEITAMLDRWEQIDRELLEPLGEKRGLVAADVDERTFHPLTAAAMPRGRAMTGEASSVKQSAARRAVLARGRAPPPRRPAAPLQASASESKRCCRTCGNAISC